MTQEQFDKLPVVLKHGHMVEIFECSDDTVRKMRESWKGLAKKQPGTETWIYKKAEVAAFLGLKCK